VHTRACTHTHTLTHTHTHTHTHTKKNTCAHTRPQLTGDPHLVFVEEVALPPPEVQIDHAEQQRNEAELSAAAQVRVCAVCMCSVCV